MAAAKLARLKALTEGDAVTVETPTESNEDKMEGIEVILPSSGDGSKKLPRPPPKGPPQADLYTDDRSKEAFQLKMAREAGDAKQKKAAQNETKKSRQLNQKHKWCKALRRTQRYLGLLPRQHLENPLSIPNLTWEELQTAQEEYANRATLLPLQFSQPAPYPFDNSVGFICIDVEAFERNQKLITEIGISTLDTNDLADLAPGEGGVQWQDALRARHFRIKEYSHLVNKDFIAGCADRFEKTFGESEFISIKDAPQVVASCFKHPFSATRTPSEWNESNTEDQTNRNIVLVGHETGGDIAYLRNLGYDVSNLPNLLECLDTAILFRALKYEANSRSLGSILVDLGLMGWNLHNAVSSTRDVPC